MVRFQTVRQKARIILNSDDAIKTTNLNHIIPVVDAPIRFDGAAGNNVDIANDRIHYYDHGFTDNDQVVYTAATVMTATPALTNNMNLFIKYVSDHIFQISTTAGGAAVNITAAGSATQTFTRTITFNGSSDTVVMEEDNNITLPNHRLHTGMMVRYDTTGIALAGLTSGRDYYVVEYDDNTIGLAESYQDATNTDENGDPDPILIDIGLGQGTTHYIRRIVSFEISQSPVVDLTTDRLNLPAHNLNTGDRVIYQVDREGYAAGTAISPLVDNMYYYVISVDPDSIKLAETEARALADPPVAINLTLVGTGGNHSITRMNQSPVRVCTNYRFKLDNKPFDLNEKCRLAVQSFDYIKNYNTSKIKSVGGVYLKSLMPTNTYSSQGVSDGTLLLPINFTNTLSYQNYDIENYSIPLPNNINNILHNNLDIFVDTKKLNFNNRDINGCIDADSWSLSLVVYEYDDLELINKELDPKIKNNVNPRLF